MSLRAVFSYPRPKKIESLSTICQQVPLPCGKEEQRSDASLYLYGKKLRLTPESSGSRIIPNENPNEGIEYHIPEPWLPRTIEIDISIIIYIANYRRTGVWS